MGRRWKRFRNGFYAGPRYMGIQIRRHGGYQSPTLTAALWIYAWSVRWFTLPGRIVGLCCGVVILYSLMSFRMPIYALSVGLVSIFIVDAMAGFLARPKLTVVRHLPVGVAIGAEVPIEYTVTNRGRRPAWSVHIDALPFPTAVRFTRGVPFLESVAPGEEVRVTGFVTGRRRGQFTLPAVRSDTGFPFHLMRWGTISGSPQVLLVYPSFTPLSSFGLEVGRSYQPGGLTLTSKVADSMEFFGCREYRDGDNPRHIHWRSWARTGYPVVREFREEYYPRTALILDTLCPPVFLDRLVQDRQNPRFEALISLAAAVSDRLARQDYIVDLFAAGPEIYRFQSGRGLAYFDDILGILARLTPKGDEPFEALAPEVVQEIAQISSAVVLLLTWNEAKRQLIERLVSAGITVKAFLVTGDDDAVLSAPGHVERLDVAGIHAGRVLAL